MKKGISILLIAAAVFGFYGGAVNLNDIFACKFYWEEKDNQSMADLNKLEDGLYQLRDSEEDYLDGIDQVADGEEELLDAEAEVADGEKKLAQGERDLISGRATLAKGEAAFAAAPAQLAAGKAQLDQGRKVLESSRRALTDLDKLINGLAQVKQNFEGQWDPGFSGTSQSSPGLKMARMAITQAVNTDDNKASISLIEKISGINGLIDGIKNSDTYADFDEADKALSKAFGQADKILSKVSDMAKQYAADTDQTESLKAGLKSDASVPVNGDKTAPVSSMTLAQTKQAIEELDKQADLLHVRKTDLSEGLEKLKQIPEELRDETEAVNPVTGEKSTAAEAIRSVETALQQINDGLSQLSASITKLTQLAGGREKLQQTAADISGQYGDMLMAASALDENLSQLSQLIDALATQDMTNQSFSESYESLQMGLKLLASVLDDKIIQIKENKKNFDAWDNGYQQLAGAQAAIADTGAGVPYVFSLMLSNSTIRKEINKRSPKLAAALTLYSGSKLSKDDLDDFDTDMKTVCGIIGKSLPLLRGIKAAGQKQVNAGADKLAAGEEAYRKGLAEYRAGAGKLAAGRAALADGLRQLMRGRNQLADGRAQLIDGRAMLADGKALLAEYEEGEADIRDGLATLMATEANGGLESILDRRSGDADFDNGDTHLDIEEGFEAVAAGREYHSASDELITTEITRRAAATAAGIGACVIALISAIFALLKKRRSAGILAILSAAAGGVSTAMGLTTGTEFSAIAGSTAGIMPYVAFAAVAAAAIIHAACCLGSDSEA